VSFFFMGNVYPLNCRPVFYYNMNVMIWK